MILNSADLRIIREGMEKSARIAGSHIQERTTDSLEVTLKEGKGSLASRIVTEVDTQTQDIILKTLSTTIQNYDLAVLAEEGKQDEARLEKEYFICIDPLDGTLAYSERKPGYAVSLSLVSRSGNPKIGVVYDPVADVLYSAIQKEGAYRNGEKWQRAVDQFPTGLFRLYLDRSYISMSGFDQGLKRLKESVRNGGFGEVQIEAFAGAVLNAIRVMEAPHAAYFKFPKEERGGGCIWDFAATACIAQELGLVGRAYDGSPFDLNRKETVFMNQNGVLFTTSEELARLIKTSFDS